MRRSSSRTQGGFTIIEVLVVVVVIGILASIALVSLLSALDRAKQRATMADMRTISKAIEAYMIDNSVPPNYNGAVSAIATLLVPYHTSVVPVKDHWKNNLYFSSNGLDNYTIESYGKDGVNGANVNLTSRFDFALDIVIHNGVFVASPE